MTNPLAPTPLAGQTVLIVGGSSGIGAGVADAVRAQGGRAVVAGRKVEPGPDSIRLDLEDEASIVAAGEQLGELDHVVSLAANHANGPVGELEQDAIRAAFDAKIVGPVLLAKHLAPRLREGGSFVLFSGVVAWKPAAGLAVMGTTNAAVASLVESLAVELAPLRFNAVSPGIIDSGVWDSMPADDKAAMFENTARTNPVGRVGQVDDVVAAVLLALTNGFMTGSVLHVDGGGKFAYEQSNDRP
ncbi:SDR family oxidoreductase [Nocardioides bruguierae]|uniref:SDR family oxidoreductase n=1 Tax=Nocardioides bruguierae TaxID=2945102 RepID=A0A9X2D8B8_9ACTN|nr:SDR family oxidoreductase [Nocardioides bruguierae]MCM0621162.1 SDR family oxidoreductase [Nocardioides bruguierae]